MAKKVKTGAVSQETVQTSTEPKETKSKKLTFGEGMIKVSGYLADAPDSLSIGIISKPNADGGMERVYAFLNTSAVAKEARQKISAALREVYQNGAYSVAQFATALRIDEKAVQGLIDDEFIERQGNML